MAAIIAVARTLHMTVVAPGIETEAQYDAVARADCDVVQGFLFAPPMPADQMTDFLCRDIRPPRLAAAVRTA
jgi:EAL domain-containing protein (putative c-di-GMP-specific phosphodiesterase class I)